PLPTPRKIITGMLSHESHAFSVLQTSLQDFAGHGLYFGQDIPSHIQGTRTEMGAFIDCAPGLGWQLIPTVYATTTPSGPITRVTYEALIEPIFAGLHQHPDAAAILLALHGSMFVEGLPDPE